MSRAASPRLARGFAPVRSILALAVAASVGAGGAVLYDRMRSTDRPDHYPKYFATVDGKRIADGRLTGGAPFSEYQGPVRRRTRGRADAGPEARERPGVRIDGVEAAEVLAESVESPTGHSLRDVGVLRLESGQYRLASATLERAREAAPNDARIAADLAVALLEEAIAEDVPRLAARALATADEAIAIDPLVDEAWFTRAAALERLWIGPAAIQAWHDYLARDEASPWATEARRRVCALERLADPSDRVDAGKHVDAALATRDTEALAKLTTDYPNVVRRSAMERIEKSWPNALGSGDVDAAAAALEEATMLATALAGVQKDAFVADTIVALERQSRNAQSCQRIVDALHEFDRGRQAFRSSKIDEAMPILQSASRKFADADCETMAMLAEADVARCEIFRTRYDLVVDRIEPHILAAERSGYRHLAARARWIAGYAAAVQFEPENALLQLRRSLAGLNETGDIEGATTVGFLLAEISGRFGLVDEAWRSSMLSMEVAWKAGRSNVVGLEYSAVARRFEADGASVAARYVCDAAVSAARASGNPVVAAGVHATRAQMLTRTGDRDAASRDIAVARSAAASVPDAGFSTRLLLEVDRAEAETRIADADGGAVAMLSGVLDRYAGTDDRIRTVECLRLRSVAYRAQGNDEQATIDLDRAVAELNEQRARLRGARLVAEYGQEVRSLLDLAIEGSFEDGESSDAAYAASDLKRVWSDPMAPSNSGTGPTPGTLSSALAADEAVVSYACLPSAMYVWSTTRSGTKSARVPIAASRTRELVERFRRGVESGDDAELAQLSAPLVDTLWSPIASTIELEMTVTIVGDDAIDGLPFSALVDPRSGHFLVEKNAFARSRSVARVVRCLRANRDANGVTPGSALVVGDPVFDATLFPTLQRLPGAAKEATRIAALYPNATCCIGAGATRKAFLTSAQSARVIHYAGHAVSDEEGAVEPALLLSTERPSRSESDRCVVTASDVSRLRLRDTRLVVLAACRTAARSDSTGVTSTLARAFLTAGARVVVASLWAIDDAATEALFAEFHRRVVGGEATPLALRRAVLTLLDVESSERAMPRDWAAFEVIR